MWHWNLFFYHYLHELQRDPISLFLIDWTFKLVWFKFNLFLKHWKWNCKVLILSNYCKQLKSCWNLPDVEAIQCIRQVINELHKHKVLTLCEQREFIDHQCWQHRLLKLNLGSKVVDRLHLSLPKEDLRWLPHQNLPNRTICQMLILYIH